jgi:hypothetical protein
MSRNEQALASWSRPRRDCVAQLKVRLPFTDNRLLLAQNRKEQN